MIFNDKFGTRIFIDLVSANYILFIEEPSVTLRNAETKSFELTHFHVYFYITFDIIMTIDILKLNTVYYR